MSGAAFGRSAHSSCSLAGRTECLRQQLFSWDSGERSYLREVLHRDRFPLTDRARALSDAIRQPTEAATFCFKIGYELFHLIAFSATKYFSQANF